MSYTNDTHTSPATIAAVIAVHAAIGYAFISGLAMTVIREIPIVTIAEFLPEAAPPPPEEAPPPPPAAAREVTVPRETLVDLPALPQTPVVVLPADPGVPVRSDTPEVRTVPVPPPTADLSRPATPRDRGAWVSSDDYPPAALRAEIEGTTTIRVMIGANGRVTECVVAGTSGSDLLDRASCRLYAGRARFEPARDAAGRPVAAERTDRVSWRIPR